MLRAVRFTTPRSTVSDLRFRAYMLSVLAASPLLLASRCSPTPTACDLGGTPIECGEEQLPTCINYCFPTLPEEEAVGVLCLLNPCDVLSADPDTILCPNDLGCVPNPENPEGRYGTCQSTDAAVLMGCDSDGSPPCPTGTYCRPFTSSLERPNWIEDEDGDGICVPWKREGNLCDEARVEGDPTIPTLRCEPGTICRSPEVGLPARCLRTCPNGAGDCACPNPEDEEQIRCVGGGSSVPVCTSCVPLRGECDDAPGAPRCCDESSGAECQPVPALGVSQCCKSRGASCGVDSECCSSDVCFEGSCTECGGVGDPPTDAGCCGSLMERDGVCARDCRWMGEEVFGGESCVPTGADESCAGEITCTPAGADCRPNSEGPDTDCDGVDDDCDGVPDDDYPENTECFDTPPGCQSGFTPNVPGRERCDYPNTPCTYADGVGRLSYCRHDMTGNLNGPGGCYVGDPGIGNYCTGNTDCSPGELCGPETGGPSTQCTGDFSDDPGCCYDFASDTHYSCCRVDAEVRNRCWNPGDRRAS